MSCVSLAHDLEWVSCSAIGPVVTRLDPVAELPSMADYGVEAATWSPLPWSWAAERLSRCRNYWITTVSADGRPHAMPAWGWWDPGENEFWFSCSPNSRKARSIAGNPHVVIASDDTVECVSVEGVATLVTDSTVTHPRAVEYAAKYEPDVAKRAAMVEFMSSHAVYRMVPTVAFGIIEREAEFATRATRWRFER
jgi:nitroimidazol reductase NimA-like FMN-containing flavoprotein (pyridoxamine 5'-phosphate oxidase superfamily)